MLRGSVCWIKLTTVLLTGSGRAVAQAASPLTVPIRVVNDHVYVEVTVSGRDLWFLLDTGAGQSLMNLPTADSLGIRLGDPIRVGGVGPTAARGAKLEGVSVRLRADASLRVSPAFAMTMVQLNQTEGMQVSGILGHDFVGQRVMAIDYLGKRLLLYDARSFRYAGSGARVPLRLRDNFPHVTAELILADGAHLTADLIIDVGSSGAIALGKQFVERNGMAERTGPTIRRVGGRGAGGPVTARFGRIAALRLGDAEVRSPIVAMHGDSAGVFSTDRLFEGNIGGEVLRRFTVYFDYSRKEMFLEPNGTHDESFEADMSGAGFGRDSAGSGIRVSDVMAGSPAGEAGLLAGDLITAIDGTPAVTYGLEALRRRLRRPGETVAFVVRRGGTDRVVRLVTRRLV